MRNFLKEFLDEATITGGYPSDGIGGVANDDDLPPGTTIFGDKMVPVEVPNRLTGSYKKYVPADDLNQKWDYDEFEHSQPMGSQDSYSNTLKGLKSVLGDRLWKHTKSKDAELSPDKEKAYKDSEIDQEINPEPDKDEETMNITEKIDKYLGVDGDVESINEAEISSNDRKSLARILMSNKNSKVKITSLNIEAQVSNDDKYITVVYPKSDDFTVSLVDIADSLGMEFNTKKSGDKQTFRMVK